MVWPKTIKIYTDGASKGNPGPSSIGVSFQSMEDKEFSYLSEKLLPTTNNVAEYSALVRALETAKENKVENVWVRTDSELMVKQLKGLYKVKSENIKDLHSKAYQLLKSFQKVKLEHIPRELNKRADELANLALENVTLSGEFDDSF